MTTTEEKKPQMELSPMKTFERYDSNLVVHDHTLVSSEPPIISSGRWHCTSDIIGQPTYHATDESNGNIHRFDCLRTFEIFMGMRKG